MNKNLPVGTSALIIYVDEDTYEPHVLLVLRGGKSRSALGKWALPGGGVDKNENPKDAIVREVKEETNLDFIIDFIQDISILKMDDQDWLDISYYGYVTNPHQLKIMEPHKHDDIQWFQLNELPKNIINQAKKMIEDYNTYGDMDNPRDRILEIPVIDDRSV